MNDQMLLRRFRSLGATGLAVLTIIACGESRQASSAISALPSPSAGQVAPASAAPKASFYAASRFAEQVSFGPTPALVAQIQALGFEGWIDAQMALPLLPLDKRVAEEIYAYEPNVPVPDRIYRQVDLQMMQLALTAPDQLRWRVVWSLASFIVASRTMGVPPAHLVWVELLAAHTFGRYDELLRKLSINPHMGNFLDNVQNRPKSAECPHCAPNENFARELMQLFAIGVFELAPDGTPRRDARGQFIATYTQRDVDELARAVTGWRYDPEPANRPVANFGNWAKPMVPTVLAPERDSGRKVVMGRVFPAGRSQDQDLDNVVDMLMQHANIAPFVSLRLIQQLAKSDPTPAYVQRVAARFIDNGRGERGDLKAVVKAVLLDSEARRGDNPNTAHPDDGKFKEPYLHTTAMLRGLRCTEPPTDRDGEFWTVWDQEAFRSSSVFGFYAPSDRTPGGNVLAPEQRLVVPPLLSQRLWELPVLSGYSNATSDALTRFNGGCQLTEWIQAFERSSRDFVDLASQRFFRGAMPSALRRNLEDAHREAPRLSFHPSYGPMTVLTYALSTADFGVSK